MSVIVAIKENGVVYMGADTQTTAGIIKENHLNETSYKIDRMANGILVGFCGTVSQKQRIQALGDVFTLDEQGELTKRHIVNKIIPRLEEFKQFYGNDAEDLKVSMLIAYKDKLYRITPALDIISLNDYGKSGSGADYVIYAIESTKGLPVKERIVKALRQSTKHAVGVGGPYVLIDTKTREYELVY